MENIEIDNEDNEVNESIENSNNGSEGSCNNESSSNDKDNGVNREYLIFRIHSRDIKIICSSLCDLYEMYCSMNVDGNNVDSFLGAFKLFIEYMNIVSKEEKKEDDYPYVVMLLEAFYKFRHDMFSAIFLTHCNQFDMFKFNTDMTFEECELDIDSKKTPDYIKIKQEKLLILEFSVGSNYERLQFIKKEEQGGKYLNEVKQLIELGYDVKYHNVLLSTVEMDFNIHKAVFEDLEKDFEMQSDLEGYRALVDDYLSALKEVDNNILQYSVILFSDAYDLELVDINEIQEYYNFESNNRRDTLITQIKVDTSINYCYDRTRKGLIRAAMRMKRDGNKERLILVYHGDRLNFEKASNGTFIYNWLSALEIDDRKFIFDNTYFLSGGKRIHSSISRRSMIELVYKRTKGKFDKLWKNKISEGTDFIGKSLPTERHKNLALKIKTLDLEFQPVLSLTEIEEKVEGMLEQSHPNTLAESMLSLEMIEQSVNKLRNKYDEDNNDAVVKFKSSFTLPMTHYLDQMSVMLYKEELLGQLEQEAYTQHALARWDFKEFKGSDPTSNDIYFKAYEKHKLNMYKLNKLTEGVPIVEFKKDATDEQLDLLNSHQVEIKASLAEMAKVSKELKVESNCNNMIKIKSEEYKVYYKKELSHFDIGKGIKTKCEQDHMSREVLELDYNALINYIMSAPYKPDFEKCSTKLFNVDYQGEEIQLLEGMNEIVKYLDTTQLSNICNFIAFMSHKLTYVSQMNFNKDYVYVDYWGSLNHIILVKGGKKIFKTKASKHFRLIYPIDESVIPWQIGTGSSRLIILKGRKFLLTPWMRLSEKVITENIFFKEKVYGYLVPHIAREMQSRSDTDLEQIMCDSLFPIILSIHNRRRTEARLHSLRYIIANTLASYTNLTEIIESFSDVASDRMIQFIVTGILKYYPNYAKTVISNKHRLQKVISNAEVNHPYLPCKIKSINHLSSIIYGTYLMTKSPTDQSLDQAINLKGILDTHLKYEGLTSYKDNLKYDKQPENIFEDDLCYNADYCYYLGVMASDYIKDSPNFNVRSRWESYLKKPWTAMANSSGLRSKDAPRDFFGKKGHYVVHKDNINDVLEKMPLMNEYLNMEDRTVAYNKIQNLNKSYAKKLIENPIDELIFHAVDKDQRGGGREIYVMDKITKLFQQPLEYIFSEISSNLHNEVISVPSSKRLMMIHSKIFEKTSCFENNIRFYLTMDCRKWAPRSQLNKYVCLINGMKNALPASMVLHFYYFFQHMYTKKMVTRDRIVKILSKNERHKDLVKLLKDNDGPEYKYINMGYSFMMGIFNYLSSILHSMNQLHASLMIKSVFRKFSMKVNLDMIAHSDDSAGYVDIETKIVNMESRIVFGEQQLYYILKIYEILLKLCNHMLSVKKCNVSHNYFEFLSILYINNALLPVITKFTSSTIFKPTDKGYYCDMMQPINKCIETVRMGGTFSEGYFLQRLLSMSIQRFYGRTANSNIIPQLGGDPLAHPMLSLLVGTSGDTIRLYHEDRHKLLYQLSVLMHMSNPNETDMFGSLTAQPYIKNKYSADFPSVEEIWGEERDIWPLMNMQFNHSITETLTFLCKLRNIDFIASLMNETTSRRISRSFFYKRAPVYHVQNYKLTLTATENLIDDMLNDREAQIQLEQEMNYDLEWVDVVLHKLYNDLLVFNVSSVLDYSSSLHSAIECKPVHISIPISPTPFAINFDVDALIIKHFYPEYLNLLPNKDFTKHYELFCRYLKENKLENIKSPKIIRNIFARFRENNDVSIYMYAYVSGENRYINDLKTIIKLIQSNTSYGFNYNKLKISLAGVTEQVFSSRFTYMREPDQKIKFAAFYLHLMIGTHNHEKASLLNDLEFIYEDREIKGSDVKEVLDNVFRMNMGLSSNLVPIDQKLGDLQLWYTWMTLQKRVGVSWYGKGCVYLNLLQCKLKIFVKDSEVMKVICNKKMVEFNDLEQWFLQQILNTGRRCILSCTELIGRNDYTFGMRKGKFGITTANNLDSFVQRFEYEEIMNELDDHQIYCTTADGRYMARRNQYDAYKIEFAHNLIPFVPSDLSRYLKLTLNNKEILRVLRIDHKFKTYINKVLSIEMNIDSGQVIRNFHSSSMGWYYCKTMFDLLRMAKPCTSMDVLKQASVLHEKDFKYSDPREVFIPQLIANGVDMTEIYELMINNQLNQATAFGLIDRKLYIDMFYKMMDGYFKNPASLEEVKKSLGGLFNPLMLCGINKTSENFSNVFFFHRENVHYKLYKASALMLLKTVKFCLCNHNCVFEHTKGSVYPITEENYQKHYDTIVTLFYKQCVESSQSTNSYVNFNPLYAQYSLYQIFICQITCPNCRMRIIAEFEKDPLLRILPVEESEEWLKVIIMLSNAVKRKLKVDHYMMHDGKYVNFNDCENLEKYEDPMHEQIHGYHNGYGSDEDQCHWENKKLRSSGINSKYSNISYAPTIGNAYHRHRQVNIPQVLRLRFRTNYSDSLLFASISRIICKVNKWQIVKAEFNMNPGISYHLDWCQYDIFDPMWPEFCRNGDFFGVPLSEFEDVVNDYMDDDPPEEAEFDGQPKGVLYSTHQDIINNDKNKLMPLFDLTWGHNQQYKCLYHLKRFIAVISYLPDEYLELKSKGIYCLRASQNTNFIKNCYIKTYFYLMIRGDSLDLVNLIAKELRLTHVRHKIFEPPSLLIEDEEKNFCNLTKDNIIDETLDRGQWIRKRMEKEPIMPTEATDLIGPGDSQLEDIINSPLIPEDIGDVVRFRHGDKILYTSKDRLVKMAESGLISDRWWRMLEHDVRVKDQRGLSREDLKEVIKDFMKDFEIENIIKNSIEVNGEDCAKGEEMIAELLKSKKINYDPTMPHFVVSNKATSEYSGVRDNVGFCAEFDAIAPGLIDLLASGRLSIRRYKRRSLEVLIKELKSVYSGTDSDQEKFFDFILVLIKQTALVESDANKHIWDNVEKNLTEFLPNTDESIDSTRINYDTSSFIRGDLTFF